MKDHVTVVAGLHIALGTLLLMIAGIVFLAVAGGGLLSGDRVAILVTMAVSLVATSFLLLFSVPAVIGGFGLLALRPWARLLMLVFSFLELLNIPLGTILGAYTIWVLTRPETERLFQPGGSAPARRGAPPGGQQ